MLFVLVFFFSSRRRHTRCALVTGVQTCALPISAPSGLSQAELLRSVYSRSRLRPQDIDYVVTHGTGTQLGDPVEINALYDVFKNGADKQGYCALTSTKSNLGHTFAASGLVSVISLVQAIRHETIPASLHCEEENDHIRSEEHTPELQS